MASDYGANQEIKKLGISSSAPLETHSGVLRKGWNIVIFGEGGLHYACFCSQMVGMEGMTER